MFEPHWTLSSNTNKVTRAGEKESFEFDMNNLCQKKTEPQHIFYITIHSKYFPFSDWLKPHA